MHSTSDGVNFTPYNDANEVVSELFDSLRSKYRDNLKTSMRGSDFIFDSVQSMYYKCHKVTFERGNPYIASPDWIKNQKGTVNPKNEDHICFQCAATFELNYEEIKCNTQRV